MIKTDAQLKQDIEAELLWDPRVNAAQVGVTVDEGAVSLFGAVNTYAERWAAEAAVKRVNGVRAVALELAVKLHDENRRDDADIAAMIQRILAWSATIPNSVTAVVRNGAVTLEGAVDWNYQREASGLAVRYLTGVAEVHNSISIKATATAPGVVQNVKAALERQGSTANSIHLETSGNTVTLTGRASSRQSIKDASSAAWSAPGVTEVVDRVTLEPAS